MTDGTGTAVLRIHFTEQDLARTRLAETSGPLVETCAALSLMYRPRDGPVLFAGWRQATHALMTPQARQLATLLGRQARWAIELWTLGGPPVDSIDEALDTLKSSPGKLRDEVHRAAERIRVPVWARGLARADRAALADLENAIRAVHTVAVAPHWSHIHAHQRAVHHGYLRAFRDGGIGAVLENLHPSIRWKPPVLEVPTRHVHGDFPLHGQGLILAPTVFGWPHAHGDTDPLVPGAPNVLYIPTAVSVTATSWAAWTRGRDSARRVAALMGRTRAMVLETVAERGPCGTSDLAEWLGLSAASASEHATVLRDVGLIASERIRNNVRHTVTPTGIAVLDGPD
ncbi:ArsR family transcriptional regulator [Embleya sp. NBC_00888]|uniref:ArsR/SmtB family transcription factor n=1 Tax=Embleya sp. NBC_00888 TaxID=2975960 RepID=UPI00386C0D58|nr:ArsR family transcriptional regulator [Embleya sp. NBC_00888]